MSASKFGNRTVFGITSPNIVENDLNTAKIQKSKAFNYIFQKIGHYSIKSPTLFFKTSKNSLIMAHIQSEIDKIREQIALICNSAEYQKILENESNRNNEMIKIKNYQSENQLINDSISKLSTKCAMIMQFSDEKYVKYIRESFNHYEGEFSNIKKLVETQEKAIKDRRRRELAQTVILPNVDDLKRHIKDIETEISMKNELFIDIIQDLEKSKSHYLEALYTHFNTQYKDTSIKLSDVYDYVENKDPVYLLRKLKNNMLNNED